MFKNASRNRVFAAVVAGAMLLGCAGEDASGGGDRSGGGSRGDRRGPGSGGGRPGGPGGGERAAAAVPVETAQVARRDISSFIETNGTLQAENEVDLVARTSAPVIELHVEEGMAIRQGQLLARLEQVELRARLEIARVALEETRLAYERAMNLYDSRLISDADYEQARSQFESTTAQLDSDEIQLGYTEITAPFDGTIVARYVDLAEQVSVGAPLFRVSDFDPLLCPIQIPERELSRLKRGQRAYLTVESWPGQPFDARVLRISPIVDASTGTIKVTLEVRSKGKLRPGMFARVFVETETRSDVLVVPKAALSLESIGDTIYVAENGVASRREVKLGFREGDFVEIVSGIEENDAIIVIGQDGLSDGTPIEVLGVNAASDPAVHRRSGEAPRSDATESTPPPGDGERGARPPGGGRDFASMSPEELEQARERMRSRGMSDDQIDRMLKRGGPGPGPGPGPGRGERGGPGGRDGRRPDFSTMSPEELEQAKERMRSRGMSEEQIETMIRRSGDRSGADGR